MKFTYTNLCMLNIYRNDKKATFLLSCKSGFLSFDLIYVVLLHYKKY